MSKEIKIGIDKRNDIYFAARVADNTGRPAIKSLLRFESDDISKLTHLGGAELFLAMPDQLVTVKEIESAPNDKLDKKKIIFEMSSSVFEDPDNFYYDTFPTAVANRSLGMMIRTAHHDKVLKPFENIENKTAGLIRSAGLALGYINFCQHNEGNLVALADFNGSALSLAFVHEQKILDIGFLNLESFDLKNDSGWAKLATELKVYLNFKQAAFLNHNISRPISALLVSGGEQQTERMESFGQLLKVDIARPQINRGFISGNYQNGSIPLEMYLVALGLTVN